MRLALPITGAVALAIAALLDLRIAERTLAKPYDVTYVPSGAAARIAALGHRTFLSDLYWLSAVQYIGEPAADRRGWDKLSPLVDLVTDLDPRHGYAYQTAGIVLSQVGRLDESNRILQKGIEKGPPRWTFPYYISFNHWFYRGDYETAAEYARIAARVPGASPNISHLALSLSAKSGKPEDAIAMLEAMRSTVSDEFTASRLDEQLKLAVLERDAQALERAAERFRAERGRDPFALEELLLAGYVTSIPEDPFGGRYVWNAAERKVRSSANAFRFPPPEGPQQTFHSDVEVGPKKPPKMEGEGR
jgi:tetratricopeptide (TPR) repeat protein